MKRFFKTMAFTLLGLVLSMNLGWAADSGLQPSSGKFIIDFYDSEKLSSTNGTGLSSSNYASFVKVAEGLTNTNVVTGVTTSGTVQYGKNGGLTIGSSSANSNSVSFTIGSDYAVNKVTVYATQYENGRWLLNNNAADEGSVGNKGTAFSNVTSPLVWDDLDGVTTLAFTKDNGSGSNQKRLTIYTIVCEYSASGGDCTTEVDVKKGTITGAGCDITISDEKVCADGDGGSVTVTPSPAAHYHCTGVNATVGSVTGPVAGVYTVSGITDETTISASFAEDDFATISWSVNGNPVTGGSTKVYVGAKVSSLPTDPDAPTSCDEKVFVGWTNAPVTDGEEPDILFTAAADAPAITSTGTVTYYAVFADEEAGGTTSVTKDIIAEAGITTSVTLNESSNPYQIGELPITLTGAKGTNNYPAMNYNATNGTDLRFYKGTTCAVTFATTNNQPITKIEFLKNATTASTLSNITANEGTLTSNVWTGSAKSVKFTYNNASSNFSGQIFIINVTYTATGGKTYSDFVTSCVVDDRTPVKMTGFEADETTLLKGATTNTSVTNDQPDWTYAYTYSSDNEEVATVNELGVITAVGKGTANITATLNVDPEDATYKADEENKSKFIEITVNNPKVTVNFFVNGTQLTGLDESLTSQEEGANLVCPANPADIGSKVFVGWKLGAISGSTDDEPELVSSSTLVGNAEQNYHAVFATKSEVESTTYSLVSSASDLSDGNRVVLYDKYNKKAVKVNNNTLAVSDAVTSLPDQFSNPDASIVWTLIADNSDWKIAHGDYTLGATELPTSGSKDATLTTTNNTWYFNKSTYSGYTDCFYIMNANGENQLFELSSGKWVVYKASSYTSWGTVRIYKAGTEIQYSAYVTTIASEYAIAVDGSIANGSVEASAASATAGSTIELTATPASDAYDFEAWNVYKTDEPATTVEVIDGKFTMPNYAVTVSATFKATDRALITWESFGTQFTQTYVSREGKIQMPEGTPTNASGCGSKYQYFMGWSTAIEGVATDAPTYITAETTAPTENTTYYAVFAKGQAGEDVNTLTFPDDDSENNGISGYSKTWTAKNGSYSWSIVNFNNNTWANNWAYIKCGSKSAASVATIATDFAFSKAIKKVVVNANISEEKLNTAKLYVSSNSDFTSATTVSLSMGQTSAATDFEFVIPTPVADQYYKLEFDCQQSSNNGFLQINSIAYKTADIYEGYATTCPSAYAITVNQPEQGGSIGASVASAEAGETITLTANPAAGYTTGTWDVYKTGESATKETVTDNAFTMPAYPVTVKYTFTEIKVTSITLNKTDYTMDANSSFQLEVTEILPADALNKEVTWSTSNEAIATVSEDGFVSGVAASATPVVITATSKSDNTVTATCSFTITDPIVWNLKDITVTAPTTTTFAEGAEFTNASLEGMVVTGQYENSIDPTDTKNEPITEGYTVKIGEHALPYTITHEDALAGTLTVTVTYNEKSDNFDLTLVPSYKTTWKVNGVPQTGVAYPATADAENKISLPTATAEALIALFGDDQYQFFRGWATEELEEEATSETDIVYAKAGDEINEDKTYYAVFAKGEMAEGWNINTEAPAANESVVLAAKDNGTYYAFAASGEAVVANPLTVTDGKITSEAPFAWTISEESDKLYLKSGDNYVHFNSKAMKVTTQTTNGSVTFTQSGDGFIMCGNENKYVALDAETPASYDYASSGTGSIFYVFKKDATTLTSFLTTKCDNKVPAPTVETVKTPTTITLNWGAVDGIESWNVTFDGETTIVNANTYKATGLEMESEHSYKVVAVPAGDYCGAIAASGSVSTIACNTPTPETLSVTDLTATTATLNWNAIDGASAYKVQVTDGSTEINMEVATNSYEVTGLSPNTYYMWSVKAFVECWGDANEEGEFTTSADVAKFNLTLNATHGEISSAPEAGLVEEGEDVMMEAINPADGYMFGSWSYTGLSEADVEIDENTLAFTMPHGDVTVTANFIEIPTITWKVCGETVATTPATNGKVGTVKDAPTTWKYDNQFKYFAGWVKGEDVETPVYATADMPITENTTFNAAFSKDRKAQYQLVTDVANLAADDELVIVGLKTNGNVYYAAGEIPSTKNYLDAIEIAAPENNIITIESEDVLVFTLGGNTDAWTFKANDKYLASSSAEANLWDGDYKTWKLSNSSTAYMVVMTSVQYTTGKFEFNMSSPRFRNYKGSQEDLYFYNYSGSIYENLTIDPQPDYGRTDLVVGNYGTVCVPYAVKTTDRSGATFWSIETSDAIGYTNPTSVTIVQEEGDLEAGKPYIFCATDTKMELFFSGEAYDGGENYPSNNGLYGNLTDAVYTINESTYEPGYFFVLQQKLYECGTNCTVAPNRGWVQAAEIEDKSPEMPMSAPRRTIGRPNGTPTGIDNLNGEGWIELNGAHKYFHNGTIMIVNDGHLYNAQGIRIQ